MAEHIYSGSNNFWVKYQQGRPHVPESYFERIFSYHAEHGGQFGTAHDTGAGGGIHGARLAKQFERVLVTDASADNIEAAKTYLREPQYDFQVVKLEDTTSLPVASVDLVFASVMLHFTDVDRALAAVAHQLKPGGTFAASLHGFLTFDELAIDEKFIALMNAGLEQVYEKIGEDIVPVVVHQASGYDSIAVPESSFRPESIRLRLNDNSHGSIEDTGWYRMLVPKRRREHFNVVSKVTNTERVVWENDDEWLFRGDITAVKRFMNTVPFDLESEDTNGLWNDLIEAIGEKTVKGKWVVRLVLATRK